jgi:CheY-like chemotaxis protein
MPGRVLLVDDGPALATLLRLVLEGGGEEVAAAATGRAALERPAAFAPDHARRDMQMPVTAVAASYREVASSPPRSWARLVSSAIRPGRAQRARGRRGGP